jgi:hypothetical protein
MTDIEEILNEDNSENSKPKKRFAVVMMHDFDSLMAHHAILELIASRHYGGLIVVRDDEERRIVEASKDFENMILENLREIERERIIIRPIQIKDIYIERKLKTEYYVPKNIPSTSSQIKYNSIQRQGYRIIKQPNGKNL